MSSNHILHIIDSLDPLGGASVACMRLAEGLRGAGISTEIVYAREESPNLAEHSGVPCTRWTDTPEGAVLSKKAVADAGVVHLHGVWDPILRSAARVVRGCGKPCVLTPHGMLSTWPMARKPFRKRVYLATAGRGVLAAATRIHLTAEEEREQVSRWVPREKTWVAPLVNDLSNFFDAADRHPRKPQPLQGEDAPATALFLSRINPKKGLDRAIAVLPLVPGLRLQVAGKEDSGYRQTLEELAARLGVADRIDWLGAVSEERKLELYATSDLFLLPTHQENFGQVLVEAMAAGCPVVTTRGTDIWRELEEGGAVIADPEPAQLSAAIRDLLADPSDMRRRSELGGRHVRAWLDPREAVKPYLAMYEELVCAR